MTVSDARRQEDLALLRSYEPVLRFTRGEMFLPMSVESYLRGCGLWRANGQQLRAADVLTTACLAEVGAAAAADGLSLRFVERPLTWRELRRWRHQPGRTRFVSGNSRFATVGLLGRLIDAVMRLSLLLRGRVPGGTTAAAEQRYRSGPQAGVCPYYGHVTRDRGFVALQYWFLYAMNDWRSTFGGVNDHEADWEQVTVFLADPPEPGARPAWVAFSSHDETGDDLRRRQDDPDIEWEGTHPVVYAGGGSHSGAYLPGDYLVTVEPPALRRLLAGGRRLARLFLPWTRDHEGTALGIPFIDYRRGDGVGIGPGTERPWSAVLIDDETPWVRDFRGLWGLDTGDPFGGERAPAGPRYERTGSVRRCWSDPVGWAGLDKETPSPAVERRAVQDRITELDGLIAAAGAELDARGDELRRIQAGIRALDSSGTRADRAALAAPEEAVDQVRVRRLALGEEREALTRAAAAGLPPGDPHAHLRHRAVPNVDPVRTRHRVLRVWSTVSASVLLVGLALIVLDNRGEVVPALVSLAVLMLCVEAFARGHLVRFVVGLVVVFSLATVVWAAAETAIGNWRLAVAALLILSAAVLLLANVRDFFLKR